MPPPPDSGLPIQMPSGGEHVRTNLSPDSLTQALLDNLGCLQGRVPELATTNDWYNALAYTVRDRMLENWIKTVQKLRTKDVRIVSYLSAEFLMGPHLGNNLINLGLYEPMREAVARLGLDLDQLIAHEVEPGLGNGGLGRLAACYLDSLATLEVPAIGYGLRYEFGIFKQIIRDGWQVEMTDKWLRLDNPWEIHRPEITVNVQLGGHTEAYNDSEGRYRVNWIPHRVVKGVAYDTPVVGYGVTTVNMLRLWRAEAVESFDFQCFNVGNYYGAVEEKVFSENLTKVLYPNDEPLEGRQLRLEQQYFLVSCALQDIIRIQGQKGNDLCDCHRTFTAQLNDTHPSLAVAEWMRLLVDEHLIDWERAWESTRSTFAYTNHTLLPEALEKWPLPLFESLLPRHLEIIYEINRRFLDEVRVRYPGNDKKIERLSLIDEAGEKHVRMAHLACVGSHAINGVAALHTELLKRDVLRDFCELYPERFHNITNGVTPRRWMVLCNPRLASLITRKIGDRWVSHLEEDLKKLEPFAEDPRFREEWRRIKLQNKQDLASLIKEGTGVIVDPETLFDVQVKRLHEYKRQHLNVLHLITLYQRIKRDPGRNVTPRTVIFGGKAAPSYFLAKLIIKLIHAVAHVVNNDREIADRLRIVFLPDFNVKNGQYIYPAADLSEQISTAGKEASGTGNMKFAMNGALTIGTLDGANVEMRAEVGAENFFLFGLNAREVYELKSAGYHPMDSYDGNPELREAIDLIGSGFFSQGDQKLFKPIVDSLLYYDEYLVLADYQAYVDCQEEVNRAFGDRDRWTRMAILNVARMGKFSSDRAIREYCERIWHVEPGALL